jgi:hypothetical protein
LHKLLRQLKQQEAEIDKLKAKVYAAKDDIRTDLLKEINALRAKKESAEGKINQLQEAVNDDMWDNLKAGVEKNWTELLDAFSEVYSKLK